MIEAKSAALPLSPSETDLLEYDGGIPAPLRELEHVIVTQESAEEDARRQRALVMTRGEFKRTAKRAEKLEKKLALAGYANLRPVYKAVQNEVQEVIDLYFPGELPTWGRVKELALKLEHDDKALLPPEWEKHRKVLRKWAIISRKIAPLRPMISEYARLRRAIEDHWLALEREAVEKQIRKALLAQCQFYERAIIKTWKRLGFYQTYEDRRGRTHYRLPAFGDIDYSLDTYQYKIDAVFEDWRGIGSNVPDGVYVLKHLLSPETLDELTVACQRQVTAEFDARNGAAGAWVVVNRLQSIDGLLNYVTYDDVMKYYPKENRHKIPLCIGVGENRRVEYFYLSEFPHWLIAGFTGAGKSNLVNVLISTLITQYSPEDVRLVLIDMKGGLEFDAYEGIPHLHGKIISTIEDAVEMLAQLEAIMKDRFKRFRGIAKSIEAYHRARPDEYMPHVVCVIDELAELANRGDLSKRANDYMREIMRLARAVGIHIIGCTQRPDVNAVSGDIKINMPVRIAFLLPAPQDSMTVLGTAAATKIAPVTGRAIAQVGTRSKQVQTSHMTDEMNDRAIAAAKEYPNPPMLDLPSLEPRVSTNWTIEKIIELSIKHLGGNITFRKIYEAAGGSLSQSEARRWVEQVWNLDMITFEGKRYVIDMRRGGARWLIEMNEAA